MSAERGPHATPGLTPAADAETGRAPRQEDGTGNMSDDPGNAVQRASTTRKKGGRAKGSGTLNVAPEMVAARQVAARPRKSPEQVTVGDLAAEIESRTPAEPAGAQIGPAATGRRSRGRVAHSYLAGRGLRVNFGLERAGDDAAGTAGRGCADPGAPACRRRRRGNAVRPQGRHGL